MNTASIIYWSLESNNYPYATPGNIIQILLVFFPPMQSHQMAYYLP